MAAACGVLGNAAGKAPALVALGTCLQPRHSGQPPFPQRFLPVPTGLQSPTAGKEPLALSLASRSSASALFYFIFFN